MMKKILGFSPTKVFAICGLGLVMTLGAFWHHQANQAHQGRMNVLNQGVATCFNRISQTFTAMMIKDINSPYLHRGFMGLSDECLNETIKGINPFRQNVGKGYETLKNLISSVHWFHEKIIKIHTPMVVGQGLETPLAPISERFTKMEAMKVSLVDEIDAANAQFREVQMNDEVVMGAGLLLFVLGLSILSLQEFNRIQLKREIEKQALNLLKAGQANVGAIVDQLIEKALLTQSMPVTAQIFKDYHGEMLERSASKFTKTQPQAEKHEEKEVEESTTVLEAAATPRTSLKEVLVSLQNVHSKEVLNINEVRDVQLAMDFEGCEQMLNAALNKLVEKNSQSRKILISNQIHSDRAVINFFLAGETFTAAELEFSGGPAGAVENDMNLMILKEMVTQTDTAWHLENKADRQGNITGMSIRLTAKRAKDKSKLISVVKGKKKDLTREMMN